MLTFDIFRFIETYIFVIIITGKLTIGHVMFIYLIRRVSPLCEALQTRCSEFYMLRLLAKRIFIVS